MPEKNNHYKIKIEDLGGKGEGIGKINGFAVFVEGAVIGDIIEVRIVKVNKSFAYGKLIKIIEPSNDRAVPACSAYPRCGGCGLQHISYEAQLRYKTKKVRDALSRIGGLENVTVEETIGMENPYNYRNKAQYPVSVGGDEIITGFYAARSHTIIPVDDCILQHTTNKDILTIIKKFFLDYKIQIYDEQTHTGLLRHILLRTGFKTGEIMVCLVLNGERLPHCSELVERLKKIDGVVSIVINENKQKTNVIMGQKTSVVWGKPYINDYISDLKYEISAASFFQVNPVQTQILYEKALALAELEGGETVIDAYCGIGTISFCFAKKAKKVTGIEFVSDAVKDAKRNAILNNIKNVEFIEGKSEDIISALSGQADVLVVDPPRKGLDPLFIEAVLQVPPDKIIYISCDPATLARDLKLLHNGGYIVGTVQPVDMFPHTCHVETVVSIQKKIACNP